MADDKESLSRCIYDTFKTSDGLVTLSWILNDCGFFESDPARISPELIAFCHRLIKAGGMAIDGDMGLFARAILDSHAEES